jgi:hypothetical protein
MIKLITAIALSMIVLGSASATECRAPQPRPDMSGLKAPCVAVPTVLVHLSHLPTQVELKVKESVVFAADGPGYASGASKPAVTLDSPGSMYELNPDVFYQTTLFSRGDEEGLWNAFEAVQPGTFTATVTYSAMPGTAPRTATITIIVR